MNNSYYNTGKTLKKILFFILILSGFPVLAQNNVILVNEYTNSRIESGDIFLRIVSEQIQSMTDTLFLYEDDEYFKSLADGDYLIEAELFGYNSSSVKFSVKEKIITPQPIQIFITPILEFEMESVTVVAQPPKLQREGGQFVIKDIWLSPFAKGNNSMTLLKYTPLIQVKHDNKIALTGRDAVVYINGRPSNMEAEALESYLSALPAEELDRIEIRMLTGSRYNASGSSGIINIVLRSDKQPGYDVTISSNIGYINGRLSEKLSLYADYSKSNIRIKAGAGLDESRNKTQFIDTYSFLNEQREETTINDWEFLYRAFNGFFNMDYVLSSRHTIGMDLKVRGYGQEHQTDVTVDYFNHTIDQHDSLAIGRYNVLPTRPSFSANAGINHVWNMNEENTKITTELQYILRDIIKRKDDNYSVYSGSGRELRRELRYKQKDLFSGNAFAVKSVFEHAFNEESRLEVGIETSYTETKSDSRYQELQNENYILIAERSPIFRINELYSAAYAVFGYELDDWETELGLRYEYYNIDAKDSREENAIKRTDSHFFPSFSINYNPHDDHGLSLDGEVRISHPSFGLYNPHKSYTSPNAYTTGNADIKPSLDYGLLFDYSYKGDYHLMVNYTYSDNEYTNFTLPDSDGNIRTSCFNYGLGHNLDIDAMLTKTFFNNVLNLNITLEASYMRCKGIINDFRIDVNRWSYLSTVRTNINLSKKQMIDVSILYDWWSKYGNASYYYSGWHYLSFDLKKRFKNNSSLTFTSSLEFPYKSWTKVKNTDFLSYSLSKNHPYFRISYSHKFGKRDNLKSTTRRTRAGIESRLTTE